MTNFGVELFLNTFLEYARKPPGRPASCAAVGNSGGPEKESIMIEPEYDEFSGFVFKLQANLDPRHRDRMVKTIFFPRFLSQFTRRYTDTGIHSRLLGHFP